MRVKPFTVLVLIIITVSCRTVTFDFEKKSGETILPPLHFSPDWNKYDDDIYILNYHSTYPVFHFSAVRIDLTDNKREVVISKGLHPLFGEETGEKNFKAQTIKEFMDKENLTAAINATPFYPYRFFPGAVQTAVGIVISKGILYSRNSRYDALFITNDNSVVFIHPPFVLGEDIKNGAGGFFIILSSGENTTRESPRAARSLVGTAGNGKIVFLASIDGGSRSFGEGATFYEAAEWMKAIGAENVLCMDGGGSSVLALRKRPENRIEILNYPAGRPFSYFQRLVPVFLGIR